MSITWDASALALLTPREREVLRTLAAGNTAKTAARRLGLAPSTVHAYSAVIRDKLGVTRTLHAVAMAIRGGVV